MPIVAVGGPVPESARSGRHQQRYSDDGARLVAEGVTSFEEVLRVTRD